MANKTTVGTKFVSTFLGFEGNRMNILKGSIIVIVAILGLEVQTALYRFIPEYPEVYVDCTDQPGTFGIDHFIDQSEWIAFYDDEGVHVEGTLKIIWDIKNTDRMTVNT